MRLERILAHAAVTLVCVIICVGVAMLGLRGTPFILFAVVTVALGYTVIDVVHHDGPVDGSLVRSKITSNLVFVSIAAVIMWFFVEPVEDGARTDANKVPAAQGAAK